MIRILLALIFLTVAMASSIHEIQTKFLQTHMTLMTKLVDQITQIHQKLNHLEAQLKFVSIQSQKMKVGECICNQSSIEQSLQRSNQEIILMKQSIKLLSLEKKSTKNDSVIQNIQKESDYQNGWDHEIKQQNSMMYYTNIVDGKLRIKKKEDNNIGYLYPIAFGVNKNHSITIKQITTNYNGVQMGISIHSVSGIKNPHLSQYCILYNFKLSILYESQRGIIWDSTVKKGEKFSLIVDLSNWKLKWNIDGKTVAFTDISDKMRDRDLYFYIYLFNREDQIEIQKYD